MRRRGAAILDDLHAAGAVTVATTHYGDLKRFSEDHAGFQNGCMDFDPETLMPLYRLHIGRAAGATGYGSRRGWVCPPTPWKRREGAWPPSPEERPWRKLRKAEAIHLPWPFPRSLPWLLTAEGEEKRESVQGDATDAGTQVRPFQVGDSVYVGSLGENGILCEPADAKGDAGRSGTGEEGQSQ